MRQRVTLTGASTYPKGVIEPSRVGGYPRRNADVASVNAPVIVSQGMRAVREPIADWVRRAQACLRMPFDRAPGLATA